MNVKNNTFTLEELAEITESKFIGNPHLTVCGVNTLDQAQNDEVSFLANPKYNDAMKNSNAGIICISDNTPVIENKNFLISKDPSKTFQLIIEAFINKLQFIGYEKIHPTAYVDETATIGENVTIGPFSFIDKNAHIEANTVITSHVTVGMNTSIGKDCTIYPSVVIREGCKVGNRVIVQPGVIIGSCGFGYIPNQEGHFIKLKQLGNVIIEDDVEIGSNTTIDRARFKSTIISKGSKIDNLVQIAHNVIIGKDNAIAAQTGIAGSSKTGNNILMGGQVGITGHVKLADNVLLATRSGVSKSLKKAGKYRGSPAIPLDQYNRLQIYLKKIIKLHEDVKMLQEKLNGILEKSSKETN